MIIVKFKNGTFAIRRGSGNQRVLFEFYHFEEEKWVGNIKGYPPGITKDTFEEAEAIRQEIINANFIDYGTPVRPNILRTGFVYTWDA